MINNPEIDTEWMVEFLNKGGLDRLFDTVEHVFSQPIESLMGTMKQMECLKMLKVCRFSRVKLFGYQTVPRSKLRPFWSNFTSTFLSKLYFDLFGQILLRHFWQNINSTF